MIFLENEARDFDLCAPTVRVKRTFARYLHFPKFHTSLKIQEACFIGEFPYNTKNVSLNINKDFFILFVSVKLQDDEN